MATRCWCRRSTVTATTSPASGHRWWRPRSAPIAAGTFGHVASAMARCTNSGAATSRSPENPEERHMTGDPRWSILERYPNAETYGAAITAAARELVEQGLMLEEDVERAIAAAADWGRPRHDVKMR